MLIVDPSSTCDVCLEPYSWATTANTPHAIACGHVFCLQYAFFICGDGYFCLNNCVRCLRSTQPSACPLCRKAFVPDRIKKIHVDRYTPGDEDEVNEFLRRIALLSGENVEAEDVMKLTHEIHNWLATPEGEDSEIVSSKPPLISISV